MFQSEVILHWRGREGVVGELVFGVVVVGAVGIPQLATRLR